jgi:Protein of unknown function (DUF2917)
MDTTTSNLTMTLDRAQFLRLKQPAGLCLEVTRGTLWITLDGRADDLELAAGERYCFDRHAAPAVVGTLGGAAEFRAGMPAGRQAAARHGLPHLAWA